MRIIIWGAIKAKPEPFLSTTLRSFYVKGADHTSSLLCSCVWAIQCSACWVRSTYATHSHLLFLLKSYFYDGKKCNPLRWSMSLYRVQSIKSETLIQSMAMQHSLVIMFHLPLWQPGSWDKKSKIWFVYSLWSTLDINLIAYRQLSTTPQPQWHTDD